MEGRLTGRETIIAPLVTFFGLTFLVAWTFWALAALVPTTSTSAAFRWLLFLPGTFAPGIVALALTARAGGAGGVRALLARLLQSDVPARWYVFAVSYLAAVKLTAAVAHRVMTGVWPAFGATPWLLMLLAVVASTPFQAGEEIGWRGYALPRLASRMGLARGSVLLGIIWAVWHLPLFVIPGTDSTGQSFAPYLVSVTALSVAIAWLYGHTRGSLLLVMLMHAAINNTAGIVPSIAPDATGTPGPSLMAWLTSAVLWMCAAYFLTRMPQRNAPV